MPAGTVAAMRAFRRCQREAKEPDEGQVSSPQCREAAELDDRGALAALRCGPSEEGLEWPYGPETGRKKQQGWLAGHNNPGSLGQPLQHPKCRRWRLSNSLPDVRL